MIRAVGVAVLAVAVGWGCPAARARSRRRSSLESVRAAGGTAAAGGEGACGIAVGGMITPKEGMAYYRDFLRYVQDKIGTKVEYVDREGYAEINEMLKDGQLEAAFVCSGPYVDGHAQFGLELLAAPQAYGATVYYSYIIVPKESPVRLVRRAARQALRFHRPALQHRQAGADLHAGADERDAGVVLQGGRLHQVPRQVDQGGRAGGRGRRRRGQPDLGVPQRHQPGVHGEDPHPGEVPALRHPAARGAPRPRAGAQGEAQAGLPERPCRPARARRSCRR